MCFFRPTEFQFSKFPVFFYQNFTILSLFELSSSRNLRKLRNLNFRCFSKNHRKFSLAEIAGTRGSFWKMQKPKNLQNLGFLDFWIRGTCGSSRKLFFTKFSGYLEKSVLAELAELAELRENLGKSKFGKTQKIMKIYLKIMKMQIIKLHISSSSSWPPRSPRTGLCAEVWASS